MTLLCLMFEIILVNFGLVVRGRWRDLIVLGLCRRVVRLLWRELCSLILKGMMILAGQYLRKVLARGEEKKETKAPRYRSRLWMPKLMPPA